MTYPHRLSPDNPQVIHTPQGPLSLAAQPADDSYPQDLPPLLLQETEPTTRTSRAEDPRADVIHKGQVPDRWPYLLGKLDGIDEAWSKVSIGALVRIARETSVEAVSYALAIADLTRPALHSSAYGWLAATAKTFAEVGVVDG